MKNLIALSFILPLSIIAMDGKHELVQSGAIIAGGALTAYGFGKGAEWVSNTIHPVFTSNYNNEWDKPEQRSKNLFNKWGFLGTLWAGVPVALVARIGSHPMAAQDLFKPVAITYGATLGVGVLASAYTYFAQKKSMQARENGIMIARIASYLAAPTGLIGYILYKRIKG